MCVKRRYWSRRRARAARKALVGANKGMRAYRCAECGPEIWHIGHLPTTVRAGYVSTLEVYGE